MHSIILLLAMTNFIKRIVHRLKQEGCSWYDESGTCGYLRGVAGALHGCSFEENRHHEKISLDTTHLVPAYMVRLASGDVWMLAWIVSGKAPAMISGKLAWMVLLGFMIVSTVQSKIGKKCMPKVHGGVSLLVIGLVALHAIHGLMT